MYKKINITENTLMVLALFTKGFDKEYYIREVERILKISPRTAQLALESLEEKAILESKLRGKIRLYKIKQSEEAKRYLTLAEQYKAIAFLEKKPIIKEIIKQIMPCIKGIGAVFGSYAKGTENKSSDLDIFIVGKYNREKIKRISKKWGIDINTKHYPEKIFEKKIKKDFLLKEVLKSHIVFSNAEQFVQKALENG